MKNPREENIQQLKQIKQAIGMIINYTNGETLQSFCSKSMLQDAILMQFVVIGEAVNHIEHDLLEKYSYPWHKAKAFRNLIAHDYFNIKLEAVWKIIENDLPDLEQTIKKMIELEF
jgi:uncharacterized protein with HEPN domain